MNLKRRAKLNVKRNKGLNGREMRKQDGTNHLGNQLVEELQGEMGKGAPCQSQTLTNTRRVEYTRSDTYASRLIPVRMDTASRRSQKHTVLGCI